MKRLIIFIFLIASFLMAQGERTYKPGNWNWLYNVRAAGLYFYNQSDSTLYPVSADSATGALKVMIDDTVSVTLGADTLTVTIIDTVNVKSPAYSALPVFSTTEDSARLTNAVELAGRWITLSESYDGAATLFVAGDSISGTTATVTVYYQQLISISSNGDSLKSEKFTLGTVAAALQKETIGDGSLIGETFIMGDDAEWTNAIGIISSFVGIRTQVTDLKSTFKRGR